jgi:hypothetical protein
VPKLASPDSRAKVGGRSAKHAVDEPLGASELDVAVRAFEHLSRLRSPRAQRIIEAMLAQHSFATLIDYGLLRYPHDCPPAYRRYCFFALERDPGFLYGFRLDLEQRYAVSFELREDWVAYVREAVEQARRSGFALFTDQELEQARALISYERARYRCEERRTQSGEPLTQAEAEQACHDQSSRRAQLDESYCYDEPAQQWGHCPDPALASITLPEPIPNPGAHYTHGQATPAEAGTASQPIAGRDELVLALTCWTEDSAILGMPLSPSDNGVTEFNISVDDTGIITMNGQAIEMRYMGYTEAGRLRYVAAAVPDILTAISEQAAMGRAMPGVSQDDVNAINQVQSFFMTFALAGRDRVLFADIEHQAITFADVQNGNLTNQAPAVCR